MIDKELVKRNFSRCARHYDNYSAVQDLCGARLIERTGADSFDSILDVGCGTGSYTALLRKKFPGARIKAIDISAGMIEVAKRKLPDCGIDFTAMDGEEIDFNEAFDLVSSNATFQWFGSPEKTIERFKAALRPGGTFLFSAFGPRTLNELARSLVQLFGKATPISSAGFMDLTELNRMLKGFFKEVEVEEWLRRKIYDSLPELLDNIRYTGTRGSGIDRYGFWSAGKLRDLETIYRKAFMDIIATYQVFFCKGVK